MTNSKDRVVILALAGLGAALLGLFFWFSSIAALLGACAFGLAALSVAVTRLRSVGTAGVALLVSLAVAELMAPFFLQRQVLRTDFDASSGYLKNYFTRSGDLGSKATPGSYTSKKITDTGEPVYDVTYTIGEDGFRVTPKAKEGRWRINFLGCSFTFGEGVNDDQTLPYYIGELMEDASVKNYGFHGYGMQQALAILQSKRDTKGAVNFLLAAPWHVPRSACKLPYVAGSPRYEMSTDGKLVLAGRCFDYLENPGTIGRLLNESNLAKLIDQARMKNTDEDFELYFRLIKEIVDLSHQRHQAVVVAFIKADEAFFSGTSFTNEIVYRRLEQLVDGIVDVTLATRVEDLDRAYYIHPLDKHPTALANRKRAEMLVDVLGRYRSE